MLSDCADIPATILKPTGAARQDSHLGFVPLLLGLAIWSCYAGLNLNRIQHESAGGSALFDLRLMYVADHVLMNGGNPYAQNDMVAEHHRLQLPGYPAGIHGSNVLMQPPLVLLAYLPLSLLPWKAAIFVFEGFMAAAIVVVSVWLSKHLPRQWRTVGLATIAVVLAVTPPVWQNAALGQIGMFMTLLLVATVCSARVRTSHLMAFAFTALALLKITCTIPLLSWLFFSGTKPAKIGFLAAIITFVIANLMVARWIGVDRTILEYRENLHSVLDQNGGNDPWGTRKWGRIDMLPLVTNWLPRQPWEQILSIGSTALMLLTGLVAAQRRNWPPAVRASILSASGLLLAYHRQYDAVMLIPALAIVCLLWDGSQRLLAVGLTIAIATPFLLVGDHSPMSRAAAIFPHGTVPSFMPSLSVLVFCTILIACLFASRPRVGQQLKDRHHPEQSGDENAAQPLFSP